MQITKLTKQINSPDRVNIFIDGAYEFSLTLDEVLEHKIKVGKELDAQDLKILKKVSDDGKLKARTLEWLLARPRAYKELKDYLHKKKLDKEQIIKFCEYFTERGYQNDEQFAKWWVDQRVRKNKSDLSIIAELKQKGISEDVIANVLQLQVSNSDRLKDLIVSKKLINKYPDKPKLIRYLASKGFTYSDIVDVLDELSEGTFNL